MIEVGTIVELYNNKKYIITDSIKEYNNIYYLALEVDYDTEIPKENSVFLKHIDNELIQVDDGNIIDYLKQVFVDKFLKEVMSET